MSSGTILLDDTRTQENIVTQVLTALQQRPPWDRNTGLPTNPATGGHYTAITSLMLDVTASQHGFRSQFWATADNWSKCGCNVRGSGHELPYEADGRFYWLRFWHADEAQNAIRFQSVGKLDPSWDKMPRLLAATGANVMHEDRPYPIYVPPTPWRDFPNHIEGDVILAPPMDSCRGPAHYWHNIAHELFHWAEIRTNWLCHDMAKREFVAELGSAWIIRSLGLSGDGDQFNFMLWLPDWLETMRGDPGWLFDAVRQVSGAIDLITHQIQRKRT